MARAKQLNFSSFSSFKKFVDDFESLMSHCPGIREAIRINAFLGLLPSKMSANMRVEEPTTWEDTRAMAFKESVEDGAVGWI